MFKLFGVRTAGVLVVAVALFAVVGFAASFAINGGDNIVNAEGETLVESCTPRVQVSKEDVWRNPTEEAHGGYYVRFVNLQVGNDFLAECDGLHVYIVLTDEDGNALAIRHDTFGPLGKAGGNFGPENIRIADLHDIHVLISDTVQNPIP
jgi:hypothetical protein